MSRLICCSWGLMTTNNFILWYGPNKEWYFWKEITNVDQREARKQCFVAYDWLIFVIFPQNAFYYFIFIFYQNVNIYFDQEQGVGQHFNVKLNVKSNGDSPEAQKSYLDHLYAPVADVLPKNIVPQSIVTQKFSPSDVRVRLRVRVRVRVIIRVAGTKSVGRTTGTICPLFIPCSMTSIWHKILGNFWWPQSSLQAQKSYLHPCMPPDT